VFFSHRTWISRIRPMWRDIRATRQSVDAGATEAFGGMRVVRSFSRQKTEAAQFIRRNHLMIRQELLAWWWSRGIDIAWSILIPVASAALLWYGGTRILEDQRRVADGLITFEQSLTVGDLVMFLAYLGALLGPLATLAASATSFQNGLAGLDRVLDLLGEAREMPVGDGAVELSRADVRGRVVMTDVSFNYPRSDKPVLAEINLDVQAGQMIALVGPSGAGKTTFCNLVARFYDPTTGSIQLDGRDLRDIVVDSYRRLLGIVEQDIFLFDGSVAQNIAYGRRGASMAEIERAAGLANADGFITDMPRGYDTLIGERGVKLSGGQRQRLAIARAILADPKILILDEATSNLDTESERLIQTSLQTLMAGRTSFVIAHRLSTIAHADWILVLEGGRIVEQGRHRELMARSGRYRDMVELQTAPRVENDQDVATEMAAPK
jgi:ATP-binding cassette subfamily B protein/subfamily B ATP-binding cassette protein MsbA